LEHLGIRLEPDKNGLDEEVISDKAAGCVVMVVPTNEDLVIARHTYSLVFGGAPDAGA
jgi:acetate kinase